MELGFSVAAGPLSQLSFDLKDALAAVRYTKQVYASYKGRDQIVSLEQSLASSRVSISTTSAFNKIVYLESRQQFVNTSGVARNSSNVLCRVLLPGTSTAFHGHPGLVCLRALTTALLCLMQEETIVAVFRKVLPKHLLHHEQEGEEFAFEGPSLLSLKRYIHSIAEEEQGDQYRQYLLQHVDDQVQQVTTNASALNDLLASEFLETGHIVALLNWVLTPVLKRESNIYRTRSLKIWCIAVVLSKVAFELEVNCNAITALPIDQPEEIDFHHDVSKPEVVLVLASGWPTDIGWQYAGEGANIIGATIDIPPRAISVRAFPATAKLGNTIFLRHAKDTYALEEAFRGSYIFVRQQLSQNPFIRAVAGLQNQLPKEDSIYVDPLSNESLPGADVSMLLHTFRTLFDPQFRWCQGTIDNAIKPLMIPLFVQYLLPWHKQHNELADGVGQSTRLMLNYLVFASILGAVSLFIRSSECGTGESGLDMHFVYQHSYWETFSKQNVLATCFRRIMSFLSRTMMEDTSVELRYEWKALVLQVLLGMQWATISNDTRFHCQSTWGAEQAGLAIVSEFLLRPTRKDRWTCFTYHSILGRLIDIPTQNGYIEAYNPTPKTLGDGQYHPLSNRNAILTALSVPAIAINNLRLDLEPCWEDNPDKCSFLLRIGGLPKSQLSINRLYEADTHWLQSTYRANNDPCHLVSCDGSSGPWCPGPETILCYLLYVQIQWLELPLQRLVEAGKMGEILSSPVSSPGKTGGHWIVQTHGDEFLLRLAIMCRLTERSGINAQKIITNCLGAALWAIDTKPLRSTMIILHNQTHNRLFDSQGPDYDPRNDLLETAAYNIWVNIYDSPNPYVKTVRQLSSFIWQPPDHGDTHGYPDLVADKLGFYRYHGGITKAGILAVLQHVNLDKIIDHKRDVAANKTVITEKTEAAIKAWQEANLSRREIQYMLESIHAVDGEIDRSDDPLIAGRTPQGGERPDGGRYEDLPRPDHEYDSVYESGSEDETGQV